MDTIKLAHPLAVNGATLAELQCDFDKLTTQDFMAASAEVSGLAARSGGVLLGTEFDAGLHVALACRAIARTMPGVDVLDVKRVTGADVLKLQRAGRAFCLGGLED